MRLTNLGGATGILEHNGKRMLFDPWLDEGIFHGAWYHYPPVAIGPADLGRVDYIYISHIHEDHCSAGTIRHLNSDAEILLMDRAPNYVYQFLKSQGFTFKQIHLIKPRTPTRIAPDLVVDMLEGDPANEMAHMVDSALILNWDGFIVYNANDCQPYEAGLQYLKDRYPQIDLALLPYAGGSGYPSCYMNLSHGEKLREKERILNQRLNSFAKNAHVLGPKYVMPFADQYVVAGSRAHLNQYISHPASPGVVEQALATAGIDLPLLLLNSGQSFDFEQRIKEPADAYRPCTEQDREDYIEASLQTALYDHEKFTLNPSVSLERLVAHARARLWQQQQARTYTPDFSLYLDASDSSRRFRIHLQTEHVQEVEWTAPLIEPFLRLSASNTLLMMLLIGHVSWNIADAALFLDYERVPNRYDPEIYVFLNYLKL